MEFDFNGNIRLSRNLEDNYIQIDNEDFYLSELSSKGASSILFTLHDPNGEIKDRAIKICKEPYLFRSRDKRIRRFEREIEAFRIAKRKGCNNVIEFYKSGKVEILDKVFLYIVLEKADSDLVSYLEENEFKFTLNQKLSFCISILNGIHQLHNAKIYHRDIKHDNILLVNREFKIGDLGLADFQDVDSDLDYVNEKIGPVGWLSPEATNKMLTKNKEIGHTYDCQINAKSDIFQLGKLFWYIFQGNLPLGQLTTADSRFEDEDIYHIIFLMLLHNQDNRPNISYINELLEPIKLRLAV